MVRSYGVPIFRVKTVVCVDVVCQFFVLVFTYFSSHKLGFTGVYIIFLISAQKQIVGTR